MTRQEFQTRIIPLHSAMYRAAYALTGNKDEACDLVQDTMVRLWNNRDNLDEVINPSGYCVMAIKRRYIDHIRSRHDTEALTDLVEESTERADIIEHRSSLDLVKKIIETLPENQKTVMKLSSFTGCSNEEIVEITGFSNDNVRSLLSRARKTVKKLFLLNN